MFLHVLDPDEGEVFVDAAWHLIHVDDEVDEREEVLLAELQTEMGMDPMPHSGRSETDLLTQLGQLEAPIVRRVVLLELAGIAAADGEVHRAESDFLRSAASALSLPDSLVDRCVDFAFKAQGVWIEGRQLVVDE